LKKRGIPKVGFGSSLSIRILGDIVIICENYEAITFPETVTGPHTTDIKIK
jgi:hypothetical protein